MEDDVYQLYEIQRQFGEQAQQALITRETEGFGRNQDRRSLLIDQEMGDISVIEKMP